MRTLADATQVGQLVAKLADTIQRDLSQPGRTGPWALVGVRTRGVVLAERLAPLLKPDHVGTLDVTLYRDDLSEIGAQPVVRTTEIPFNIDGMHVVLVDDVLMTGRSVRAAMQSLMDIGRPQRVWLSVLVDRGGRELPIAADHVAMDLSGKTQESRIAPTDRVDVQLVPIDKRDAIVVRPRSRRGGSQ